MNQTSKVDATIEFVEAMPAAGGDPTVSDHSGRTAVDAARVMSATDTADLLEAAIKKGTSQ